MSVTKWFISNSSSATSMRFPLTQRRCRHWAPLLFTWLLFVAAADMKMNKKRQLRWKMSWQCHRDQSQSRSHLSESLRNWISCAKTNVTFWVFNNSQTFTLRPRPQKGLIVYFAFKWLKMKERGKEDPTAVVSQLDETDLVSAGLNLHPHRCNASLQTQTNSPELQPWSRRHAPDRNHWQHPKASF